MVRWHKENETTCLVVHMKGISKSKPETKKKHKLRWYHFTTLHNTTTLLLSMPITAQPVRFPGHVLWRKKPTIFQISASIPCGFLLLSMNFVSLAIHSALYPPCSVWLWLKATFLRRTIQFIPTHFCESGFQHVGIRERVSSWKGAWGWTYQFNQAWSQDRRISAERQLLVCWNKELVVPFEDVTATNLLCRC